MTSLMKGPRPWPQSSDSGRRLPIAWGRHAFSGDVADPRPSHPVALGPSRVLQQLRRCVPQPPGRRVDRVHSR